MSACAASQRGSKLAGTSSFGMSGVNAHAILSTPIRSAAGNVVPLIWERARYYALPKPYAVCSSVKSASMNTTVFMTDLGAPRVAKLRDAVWSRIVSTAILTEVAMACVHSLCASDRAITSRLVLNRTVFGATDDGASLLRCTTDSRTGRLSVGADQCDWLSTNISKLSTLDSDGLTYNSSLSGTGRIFSSQRPDMQACTASGTLARGNWLEADYVLHPSALQSSWDLAALQSSSDNSQTASVLCIQATQGNKDSIRHIQSSETFSRLAISGHTISSSEGICWKPLKLSQGGMHDNQGTEVLFGMDWQVAGVGSTSSKRYPLQCLPSTVLTVISHSNGHNCYFRNLSISPQFLALDRLKDPSLMSKLKCSYNWV